MFLNKSRFSYQGASLLEVKTIFTLLSCLFIALFSVFPLFVVIARSFYVEKVFTLSNYADAFSEEINLIPFLNTMKISFGATIFAVIIGVALAWLVARTDLPSRERLKFFFLIPFIIPPYVGAIAWILLANPNIGYLNRLFSYIFDTPLHPLNIYTMWGIIWVMGLFFYPLVFMPTYAILEKMDTSLEESAYMSGARSWEVVKDITIPLAMPGILSGALLVYVLSAASFGVPAMIGLPGRVVVLTTKILEYIYEFTDQSMSQAVALSCVLMFISLCLLGFNNWFLRRREYTVIGGKSLEPYRVGLGKYRTAINMACWVFVSITGFLPLAAIITTSFLKTWGAALSLGNLGFYNYKIMIFEEIEFRNAFMNSFILATCTATAGGLLATFISYLKIKTKVIGKDLLDALASLPYSIPGMIIALAFILTLTGKFYLNIYNTYAILFLAYLIKYLSFPLRTTAAAFEQVDDSLEESARMCGSSWLKGFRSILFPLIKNSIIAGWFMLFLVTFSELTLSLLLYGPQTTTIGVLLYEYQMYEDPVCASVLATIIVFVVFFMNFAVKKMSKGQYGI